MLPSRSFCYFTFRVMTYINKIFAYTVRFTSKFILSLDDDLFQPIVRTRNVMNYLAPISMKPAQVVRGGILDCLCCSINPHTHHFPLLYCADGQGSLQPSNQLM